MIHANSGDMVPVHLPDASGAIFKVRPAVVLASLPGPYQEILICGVTTQLHAVVADWDELIVPGDSDFPSSGLRQMSVVRLGYLGAVRFVRILKRIGRIDSARLARLQTRLADRIRP
jgi:mRNA interferase MazF